MKLRLKWRWALGLALVLVAGVGLAFLRVRWQLAGYKARLQAQGVKLSVTEMTPPWAAPEDNAGPYLAFLGGQLESLSPAPNDFIVAMRLVAPGRARVGWRQDQPVEAPPATVSPTNLTWARAAEMVNWESNLLAEVRQTLGRPRLDLRLNYAQGFSLLLPQLAEYKRLAQRLTHTVLVQVRQGDLGGATMNLHALLRLARLEEEEPLLISQLVQLAVTRIAWGATWEALQNPRWPEADLAQWQQDWEALSFNQPMQHALAMERAMVLQEFARARQSLSQLDQIGGGLGGGTDSDGPLKIAGLLLWQAYWSYPDELHFLELSQAAIPGFDPQSTGPWLPAQTRWPAALRTLQVVSSDEPDVSQNAAHGGLDYYLTARVAPSYASLSRKVIYAETARRLTVTALALARYRQSHGQLPPDLATLCPEFLPAVPQDPMDGQALRYRRQSDGACLLYSIGEDGQDNGGDGNPRQPQTSRTDPFQAKDWLWPAAATPEEVAAAAKPKSRPRR